MTPEYSLKKLATTQLNEYITKVSISAKGLIAASSAAGEVVLWQNETLITLLEATEQSIDCLGFSADGAYLAAGGQGGTLYVWHLQGTTAELIANMDYQKKWLEHLAWSPQGHFLAFTWGRYVQIWQFPEHQIITTLFLEESTVLGIAWRPPLGEELAIIGEPGVKIWQSGDWDNDPQVLLASTTTIGLAWSVEGRYLAVKCLDQTISLFEWGNPDPWLLHGFPGKVRQLAWSATKDPLLAMSSLNEIVVWKRSKKAEEGWKAEILSSLVESGNIEDLSFAPQSDLLASVSANGSLCLWTKGKQLEQVLEGVSLEGFSCLAWSSDFQQLVTGGSGGDLTLWKVSRRGKGFA